MTKNIDILSPVGRNAMVIDDDAFVMVNLSKLIARLVQLELQVRDFEKKEREAVFTNQMVGGGNA